MEGGNQFKEARAYCRVPRKMEHTYMGTTQRKEDMFSEVNAFLALCDAKELVSTFEGHFQRLWDGGSDL